MPSSWLPFAAALLLLLYLVGGAIYRLFFHPLAKFPGPKLAALTVLYEAYYDVVKKGQFTWELGRMHEKYDSNASFISSPSARASSYSREKPLPQLHPLQPPTTTSTKFHLPLNRTTGPIIRIGPNELHILDPSFYDTLYSQSNRFDKPAYFYRMLGNRLSMFGTLPHALHRQRRAALNPFFSTAAISRVHPSIQAATERLCTRMEQCTEKGEVVPLFYAYRCLTVDVISEYLFGSPLGLLERADWGRDFYASWRNLWEMSPLIRQLPYLMDFMMSLPRALTAVLTPKALEVVDLFATVDDYTRRLLDSDPEKMAKKDHPTVMWEMSKSETLAPEDRSLKRLSLEANTLLSAGFETTGAVLSHATFDVLANPGVHERLVKELEEAIPDPDEIPNRQTLERLPVLSSVIKEGLR